MSESRQGLINSVAELWGGTTRDYDIATNLIERYSLEELSRRIFDSAVPLNGLRLSEKRRKLLACALSMHKMLSLDKARILDADPVRDPLSIARRLVEKYMHETQEILGVVLLDAKSKIIHTADVFKGSLNAATVSTRDILRLCIDNNAVSLVVHHNHPSGDPAPSSDDLVFTRQLAEAGRLLNIDLIDHLILGHGRYVSLRQRGCIL